MLLAGRIWQMLMPMLMLRLIQVLVLIVLMMLMLMMFHLPSLVHCQPRSGCKSVQASAEDSCLYFHPSATKRSL